MRAISNVPALALTAYSGAAHALKALAAGFQLHLSKPIDPAQLIDAVMTLSGQRTPQHA